MIKIEFLFPELCNIFAESYNLEYLSKCNSNITIVETRLNEEPKFFNEDIKMVYLGCMTENGQEKAAKVLRRYRKEIENCIEKNVIFLVTGNAIELFGQKIDCGDKSIACMGLFNFYSKRRMKDPRHNSQFVGHFALPDDDIVIVGHKSQFSFAYDTNQVDSMMTIEKGIGMNPNVDYEGVRRNYFFGTYSLGPFLIQNPYFTKFILRTLGLSDKLSFEKEAIESYEYRLNELRRTL